VTAQPGQTGPTDAELVSRVLAADREAFAAVYDRYGDRLYDFANSMLRHREDAADAVADSFVLFAERLTQLRDPDRLRPWLYAIVRSECLRRLKARKRVAYGDEEQLVEMADDATTPEESAERAALQQLVWDASAGLADRDRAILDLHLRQGLEGAELGEAMGVSANNAYVMLNRLRGQVDRSLGALLIARMGRDECEELDRLLADWDGSFSPLVRKRVARHVDQCDVCSARRKKMVSPWMLLAGVPMVAAPLGLRDRVVNDTQLVAHHTPDDWLDGGGAASTGSHRWGAARVTTGATALLALLVLATVMFWPDTDDIAAPTQAGASSTPTAPAGPATSAPLSPAPSATAHSPATTPATTTSPSQAPGLLEVAGRSLDLGRTASTGMFDLANTGDLPVTYQVASRTSWLSVGSIGGGLAGGTRGEISVRADRSKVPEGRATGRVVVTWDGGTIALTVRLDEERNPKVGAPAVPTGSSCDVVVTVRATDESGVASVRLSWSGPASGQQRMVRSGASWTTTVHITLGGAYALRATATDTRGNSATGATTVTQINPCPQ
jgi:RNA polymerase sigma factor (sigma-70 family)